MKTIQNKKYWKLGKYVYMTCPLLNDLNRVVIKKTNGNVG